MKVNCDQILMCLPDAPEGYHHSVEQVSPLIHRVWLHHEANYDYACGKSVRTVWGFISKGRVFPPKNWKQPRSKSVCDLTECWRLSGYTSVIPTTTDLTHLM